MRPSKKINFKIDLDKNARQRTYFEEVMAACDRKNDYRYFAYGGAIRGGKSYITAYIMMRLARKYPGSRWHVIRQDMPVLEATTIPTFQKLAGTTRAWTWSRDKSNYYLKYSNGSKIIFKGENLARDPLLNDFLGLETNGIWLEQAEELSERTWERALERTGSWYVSDMPPGFIFLTFNPNQNWVKEKFYIPYMKSELQAPYMYMPALPKDNPFVTEEQWGQWSRMAQPYYQQMVAGNWDDLMDRHNLWAFAYNPAKHGGLPELNPFEIVYLSFDFNVNPMCCVVIQYYNQRIVVLEVIKLPDSGTEQMCDYIRTSKYARCSFKVTGDASGRARDASQIDNQHNYTIIGRKLNLNPMQFHVPSVNPPIEKNKVLMNALLQNHAITIHNDRAKALHYDLANVRTNPDNTIIKKNRNRQEQQCDALDAFRYWCNQFMSWYLRTV